MGVVKILGLGLGKRNARGVALGAVLEEGAGTGEGVGFVAVSGVGVRSRSRIRSSIGTGPAHYDMCPGSSPGHPY